MDKSTVERYRQMIEKSGSHTGEEAVQLAKDIAAIEETMTVAEKGDRFITSPDGMFFLIDQDGFVIPFGVSEFSLPKEAEVTTSLLAPEAVGGEYAIVRFGSPSPTKAEIFSAGSLFEARAKAEDAALDLRTVALAFAAGTFNGTRTLFRSLAFVDYIFDDEEKALEPSLNTIQALVFAKSFDADGASAWAVDNGLPGLQILKAEQSTIQNKAAAGFHAGSLITRGIGDGIVAVLGRPRKSGDGTPAKVDEAVKAIVKASQEVDASAADRSLADQVQEIQDTLGGLVKQLADLNGASGAGAPAAAPLPTTMTPDAGAEDLQKDDGEDEEIRRFIPFTVIKDDERIVKGLVYEPDVVDAHGDFMTVEAVKQMAHDFMERYRADETAGIDKDHDSKVRQNIPVIESAIARKGDPDFKEGAWFIAVKVKDDAIWKDIKAGKLTGFSFAGLARARPVEAQAAAA